MLWAGQLAAFLDGVGERSAAGPVTGPLLSPLFGRVGGLEPVARHDSEARESERSPIECVLDDKIDEEGGPLVYAPESEELLQRSLDSTCRKLYRFRHQSGR